MDYSRYGEKGIRILFGGHIDLETHRKVRRYYLYLKSLGLKEIIDIIPSFTSCLIHFDNRCATFHELLRLLKEKEKAVEDAPIPEPAFHEIPVNYGGEYGPDMEFVSAYSGLAEGEIVEIHTAAIYTVFAVGFMPGFPYMGVLDKRLYAPRLESPRLKVPEGSIGLAQLQTGIYPFESPGGWRIIGKTDLRLFDPESEPYSLLKMGDQVRFISI